MTNIKLQTKSSLPVNTIISLTAILILAFFVVTPKASALSCLAPSDMISDYYVADDSYTVALVVAGEIETEGESHDQSVIVKEVYKGELEAETTVSFTYDETWNYLCAGAPAEAGTEAIYVIKDGKVSQVFTVDSEWANQLIEEIGAEPMEPTESEEEAEETEGPVVEEETEEEVVMSEKKSLLEKVVSLMKQLIALLSVTPITEVEEEEEVVDDEADYVGLTVEEARALAEVNEVPFRVVEIDGEPQAVTMDYRPGRINASVENDVVVSYSVE